MSEVSHAAPEPLLLPALVAFSMIGVRPTKGWALVKQGKLPTRKLGKFTMIEQAALRAFVESLPPARAIAA